MAIQSQYGKAFEYACLIAMRNQSQDQHVHVSHTSSLLVAQEAFNVLPPSLQNDMLQAADAAARVIIRLEPYLQHPNGYDPLHLILQEDAAGITGDVRDLIAIRNQIGWQIGISCKHNHNAVKHSRLSRTIDFGDRWFGIPCSPQYFDTITPIFDELAELRDNGYLWSQIHNKEEAVYIPILEAFIAELQRLDHDNPGHVPERFVSYLLGLNDFYKVIAIDRRRVTQIQAFNLYGTLNQPSGRNRPLVRVPQLNLPTQFFNIDFRRGSGNTVEVTCDNGWTISLRIHNASSRIEPSLKFDVRLTGVPPALYSQYEPWD